MTNGHGKSDRLVVPRKPSNKDQRDAGSAEGAEGRSLAEGNPNQQTRFRTQSRDDLQHALERIRLIALREKGRQFTTLWHHVYHPDRLREAYLGLKHNAAAGVDGVTWRAYGQNLEDNLRALSETLQRGAYRAKPVKRVFIPKPDGRERALGVTALEDKIVQRATTTVLNAVYEADFKGFSYGFRPRRSPHHALDALTVGIQRRKVNWVLDMDIRGFFDTISHGWLTRFIEHRIADQRVVRHITKWLKAGVLDKERRTTSEAGTVQGGSISPLLANIYLHYVFDLWADQWRQRLGAGDVIIVRFADDIVVGFQHRADAERFQLDLAERFARFDLELNADKTRLLEFGRYAAEHRRERGEAKPETFDFLGFTHACSRTRNGKFIVLRRTMRSRLRRKVKELKLDLRKRMHLPIPEVGRWLASIVRGHSQYYGVPRNGKALMSFRYQVVRLWCRMLRRRSQRRKTTWARMGRLAKRWIPPIRIVHPYPEERFDVMTRGKSPVR